jgi:Uma2 family endonuclease
MTTRSGSYVDAIDHLPEGATVVFPEVSRVIGRRTIDLETDPPPDIVVEIDVTNESLSKFPIYAALGVPEIWRYDGARFDKYERQQSEYVACSTSRSFPELTAPIVFECLELSKTAGQTKAIEAFRQRLRRPRA